MPQAYGFAQQHGGTLALESGRGEGTTVKLFLPVIATGYSERAVQVPGVQALPKPYNLRDVVEALNSALRLQQQL